jgi:nucleotide-binding universal stress UspA family protein
MSPTTLLCFDGSEDARDAIRCAAALVRPRAAVVVHVNGQAGVAETGAALARECGFAPVSAVEAVGDRISAVLIDRARAHDVDLIVAGSQGVSAIDSTLFGSVSSALVHLADRPVLVVRPHDGEAGGPAFLCYDGSPEALTAIDTAATLLVSRETVVASFLAPVDDDAVLRSELPWTVGAELRERLARIARGEAEHVTGRTAEGAATATVAGLPARPVAIEGPGPAWARLLDAAVAEGAACIVVGHRRASGHLGSTAYGIVHHADRPVLVVPS